MKSVKFLKYCIIASLFTVFACNTDSEGPQIEEVRASVVALDEDEGLQNLIGNDLGSIRGSSADANSGGVDVFADAAWEHVSKLEDTRQGANRTLYATYLKSTRSGKVLDNLIITKVNEKKVRFVMRYIAQDDNWFNHNSLSSDMSNFTGVIEYRAVDGQVFAKAALRNGVSYIPTRGSSADHCDRWITVEHEDIVPDDSPGAGIYDTEISYWTVLEYVSCPTEFNWNYDYEDDWGAPDMFLDGGGGSGSGNNAVIPMAHPNTPCEGNPIKNPEIAPQTNSKIKGARFGADARKQSNEDGTALVNLAHYGLDIKNNFGDAVFAMFDGTIVHTGTDEKGWGKWIMVKSIVNGKSILIVYAHLNAYAATSDDVQAGSIIGQAGDSGNLASAIKDGYAEQHLHIEIREGTNWNTATKKNPEEYVKTKFDSNGKVIQSTTC